MSEWISVDDRLPSRGLAVLATTKIITQMTGDDEPIIDVDVVEYSAAGRWILIGWFGASSVTDAVTVTHWMPLPEPPEE